MESKEHEYRRRMNRIRSIIGRKFVSTYDLNVVGYELNQLMKFCDMNYTLNIIYGKYKLLDGNCKMAIQYFNDAIDCGGDVVPKAAYYGLFKAHVNLGDYNEALKYLKKYDNCFTENFNMDLYFEALNKLMELQGRNVKDKNTTNYINCTSGYINCVKCSEDGLKVYEDAKIYFEQGNYDEALKRLKSFQKICENENYHIDIIHLVKIMTEVVKLNNRRNDLNRKKFMDSITSDEEKKKFLIDEISKNHNDVYSLVQLVYLLIRKKQYDEAYLWLNHNMDKEEKEKYVRELNNARKIVYERINYKNNIDTISDYINKADELIAHNEIEEAIEVYYEAYNKLKLPFFLYKVGEVYYSQYKFAQAKKMFQKYLSDGEMLKNNCYVYLYFCNKVRAKSKKKAKRYLKHLQDNVRHEDYADCFDNAEKIYLEYESNKNHIIFDDLDPQFNNYLREVLNSVKNGKIFRIEKINKNKLMGDEVALMQICAAPYLLEQGAIALAEKYYENAKLFDNDEKIAILIKKYELKRKEVSKK